jgi:CubicO group peptidase (beta-lactamase class C family)
MLFPEVEMKTSKIWLPLAMLTFILASCASVPLKPSAPTTRGDYGPTKEYISQLIRSEMEKQKVTGLSIALVDDQKVVWAEGFGFADKAKGIAATPDTIYRAGSISKLLTATAAMQLADDGVLNIDQPLQRYLPEFSIKTRFSNAPPITPRSLMTHHSGLPSDLMKGMWTRDPSSLDEEVALLKNEYAANPPGYVFSYSNLGVSLLGHAMEKIVDRDFSSHLSISLFLPLRMTSSSFSARIDRSSQASRAYRENEEAEEAPLRDIPAGGLNTTVLDLSRFISMVFAEGWARDHQVMRPGTIAEMLRPQNGQVPLDLSFKIGLGWMLGSIGGLDIRNAGPVAHHSGATLHHRSQLVILPEQKLGVVVLANSASAGKLVSTLAAETLKLALEAKTGITQPPQEPVQIAKKEDDIATEKHKPEANREELETGKAAFRHRVKPQVPKEERKQLSQEELKAYEGHYDTIAGLVGMKKKSDYLEAELLNRTVRLIPRPDGLLEMSYKFLGLFHVSLGELDRIYIDRETVNGRTILKLVVDGREYLAGEQLKPEPIPKIWQNRAGEYEIVNAGDDTVLLDRIRLRHEDGLLTVEYNLPLFTKQPLSVALSPLSGTEAVICGLGRGKGETVRVVSRNGEELLAFSGYLLRKRRNN